MSLTPLRAYPPLPPPPKQVHLWRIFFALPAMNCPLPAELKFWENTDIPYPLYLRCNEQTNHLSENLD